MFIFFNLFVFLISSLLMVAFGCSVYKLSKIGIFIVGFLAFFFMFLSFLGCCGSRYGPPGKKFYLILLVIYYILTLLIILLIVILILVLLYSKIETRFNNSDGNSITTQFSTLLDSFGVMKGSFLSFLGSRTFLVTVGIVSSAILVVGLILSSYMMGIPNFLKANLSYGSIVVILTGVAVIVSCIIFRDVIQLPYKALGWILIIFGSVIGALGGAGFVLGLFPQTCRLGLHAYASVLLLFMGFILVIAFILLLFPTFFMPTLADLVSEQCLSSVFEGGSTGFGDMCIREMGTYFAHNCGVLGSSITVTVASAKAGMGLGSDISANISTNISTEVPLLNANVTAGADTNKDAGVELHLAEYAAAHTAAHAAAHAVANTDEDVSVGLHLTDYAERGRCSRLDVVDAVANGVLMELLANVQFIAFLALLVALVIFYLLLIIVLALNYTFEGKGVKKVKMKQNEQIRGKKVVLKKEEDEKKQK